MGRRGNGEGSITKRKDGRWQAAVTVGYDPETGRTRRKYFYGKTRKEAVEKMNSALVKVRAGTYREPTKRTFGQWLDTWLNEYKKHSLRRTTWDSYKVQVEKHLKPALGHVRLAQLQTAHLQALYREKLEGGRSDGKKGGLSPRSVRYIHAVAHGALEQAFKEDMIPRNPAKAVELPQPSKREMKTLDREGVTAFLRAARETRYYTAYLLELATGLRRGELLGLRWQDVDLDAGTLRVEQQLVCTSDGPRFQPPKTELSRRTVGVPPGVVQELRAHRAKQAQERLLMGAAYTDQGLVFCTEEGKPVEPRGFTRMFGRILQRAGLPRMAFHDLRHTFATLSLQEGVPVRTIQETLGHHSAAFTMQVYSHVTDEMRQQATERIGNLLSGCISE